VVSELGQKKKRISSDAALFVRLQEAHQYYDNGNVDVTAADVVIGGIIVVTIDAEEEGLVIARLRALRHRRRRQLPQD
jgi:hypothetical protein